MRNSGRRTVDGLGVRGLLAGADDPRIRVLVTDDRAYDVLAGLLPDARAGLVSVLATAPRCVQLASGSLGWASDVVSAMVCRDLHTVPTVPLPAELTLRPVQRLPDDEPGVALEEAVAVAISATPTIEDPPAVFAEYLRSLPSTFRLFAAVDSDGVVRATSGSGVFGQYAAVIFVNTEQDWRGRGIGQAMTAAALRAAQRSGATQACLEASSGGRSIYHRIGFETVGTLMRFLNHG